jgi:hypothetical protein
MRKHLIAAAATSALAAALAGSADAQTLSRHVSIEAQVRALHDTNVARSSEALAALRGVERSDTIISPSLVANILLPVSRQSFFLTGSAGYDYYQRNEFLNSSRSDLTGGMNLHLAMCEGVAATGYKRAQSDLQEISLIATRNIEKTTLARFNVTCGRAVGFAPTFGVSETTTSNSALLLVPSDYHTVSYNYGLAYRRPSLGELSIFGRHDDTTYKHRLVLAGATLQKDGYETDAGGLRFVRRTGARIGGELEIGYTSVKPTAPNLAEFKGMTYRADVDFRASSRVNTALTLERAVEPTIRPGAAFAVDRSAQLTATYALGSRLKLDGGVSDRTSRYKGVGLGGGSDLTKEEIKAIFGALRYDFGRRVALAAELRHEERNANLAGFDYSSNQVGVTAIGKF